MGRLGFAFILAALGGSALAGPVTGKLELPAAPKLTPYPVKGFTDRVENPKKPVRDVDVGQYLLVVLEPDAKAEGGGGQVTWDLVGESFAKPVIGAPVGAEVTIKNCSACRARTLRALEDPKLIQPGPINPTGGKPFKVTSPGIYTIGDAEATHLVGKLVVVASPFISHVEVNGAIGKFEFDNVPEGTYKLRVFYKTNWLDRADDTVTVANAKKATEIPTAKLPAGYPVKK